MTSRRFGLLLFLGDAAVLAAFVLIGLNRHEVLGQPNAWVRFLINTGPLLAAWAAAAPALGALRFALPVRWRQVWGRTLAAWLIAAPLALLLRAVVLRAATLVVIFAVITLALGGLSLLAWRTLAVWLARQLTNSAIDH